MCNIKYFVVRTQYKIENDENVNVSKMHQPDQRVCKGKLRIPCRMEMSVAIKTLNS